MAVVNKVGSEFLVNTETFGHQWRPSITALANGSFIVSWEDLSGTLGDASGASIKAQIFAASGAKIGTEFLVNTQTAEFQSVPTITGLANGGFVVSWTDLSETLGDVYLNSIKAQIFAASGAKVGTEFLVNTQTIGKQLDPSITGLANGGFVVSWTDYSLTLGDASSGSIKAQVFATSGARVGTEFLVNTETWLNQYNPTITGLTNGGFVVSWYDFSSGTLGDANGASIKAQIFTASGAKVGTEFLVNTQTMGNQDEPTITGLANGGFVVSWADHSLTLGDASSGSIKAQIFTASGAKVGTEFLVNTETVSTQTFPTITGLADGGFVVSWEDTSRTLGDTSPTSVKAQVFAANGTKVGTEFLVNTETASHQSFPTIAGLANGGFAVSWWDYSGTLGDASGTSIKAQVFAINQDPTIDSNGGGDAAAISVHENSSAVTTITATDPDSGTVLTYAITGGADATQFQIDDATGALSFLAAPDFEAPGDADGDNVYEVTVTASDGQLTDSQAISVAVADTTEVVPNNVLAIEINQDGSGQSYWTTSYSYDLPAGAVVSRFNISYFGADDRALAYVDGQLVDWVGISAPGDGGFQYSVDGPTEAFSFTREAGGRSVDVAVPANDTQFVISFVVNNTNAGIFGGIQGGGPTFFVFSASIEYFKPSGIIVSGSQKADLITPVRSSKGLALSTTGDDILYGLGGADKLDGGEGADRMEGGIGSDQYWVDNAGDVVVEESVLDATGKQIGGNDKVFASVSFALSDHVEQLELTRADSIDGTGNALANRITGNDAANTLDGGDGNDKLYGKGGNDALIGDKGNDLLDGGLGADTMEGGAGNDVYLVDDAGDVVIEFADEGTDTVKASVSVTLSNHVEKLILLSTADLDGTGNAGANALTGNDGANILNGGAGKDTLKGGLGADTFRFDVVETSANRDTIADFVSGTDRIELAVSAFTSLADFGLGALDAGELAFGKVTTTADQHLIYDAAKGALHYDADGAGGAAQVMIALMSGKPLIEAGDIVLI